MFFKKLFGMVCEKAPAILMAAGTGFSVSSVISAIVVAPKVNSHLESAKITKLIQTENVSWEEAARRILDEDEQVKLSFMEWLKACGIDYIPTGVLLILALICFWSAQGINVKRQGMLALVAGNAEETLRQYQQEVKEMLGKDAEKDIRNKAAQQKVDRNPPPKDYPKKPGETKRWFLYGDQYFLSTYVQVKDAQNDANSEMIRNISISETELMWLLDPDHLYLKPNADSGSIGWNLDRLMVLDIEPCLGPDHEEVFHITVLDKDGNYYNPKPDFSRLL